MKKGFFAAIICCSLIFSSSLFAFTREDRMALQGTLSASNGQAFTGIGFVDYGRWFELGANFAGLTMSTNHNHDQNQLFLPSAFGGFRYVIPNCSYFVWGINYSSRLGKINGIHIKSDFETGPYIGLEKWLSYNFLLVGYINPYKYGHQVRRDGTVVVTNQYFSTGGIAISYVFDYLHKTIKWLPHF